MASITIRNLDDDVKEQLRVRAARAGHSMEEEARIILRRALTGLSGPELLDASRTLFGSAHGGDIEPATRGNDRRVRDLDE